jgi:hypothetical protein
MTNILYTEDPKRLRATVKLYKAIITNPTIPLEDIIKENRFSKGTAYERIYDFCTIYDNTVQSDNFPEDLKFYNRFSQADDEVLTKDEVLAAGKIIVARHSPKYKHKAPEVKYVISISDFLFLF